MNREEYFNKYIEEKKKEIDSLDIPYKEKNRLYGIIEETVNRENSRRKTDIENKLIKKEKEEKKFYNSLFKIVSYANKGIYEVRNNLKKAEKAKKEFSNFQNVIVRIKIEQTLKNRRNPFSTN